MRKGIVHKIEMEAFNNNIALNMGLAVVELARLRKRSVAVEVSRLNQTVFLHIGEGIPVDKQSWLKRKANTAIHFEESSLTVKHDLILKHMSLDKTFALDEREYIAKGGAIPIFVKHVGLVGVIAVSGLHDEDDHLLIVDALEKEKLNAKPGLV